MIAGVPRTRFLNGLCVVLTVILLTACAPFAGTSPEPSYGDCIAALPQPTNLTGLFVEPDDGLDPVLTELANARCGIDVSVYLLSNDHIIDALAAAEDRGVRVRVMLEEHPFGGGGTQDEVRAELESHDIEVKWSASHVRFSHAKFMVIDRRVALVMNQNLTHAAFESNREFAVTTTDEESVEQAQAIFERDWALQEIADPDGPLIVSPTNSRERYLDLIGRADTSIDFYAEVIRDTEIVEALGAAEERGVEVRLIVDESIDADSQDLLIRLFESGVEIRLAETLYIHAKLMVIDDALAVVGSQNFTPTSLDQNRELAIVVTDEQPLARCLAVFERDWLRAAPGSPTGDAVENSLAQGIDKQVMYG